MNFIFRLKFLSLSSTEIAYNKNTGVEIYLNKNQIEIKTKQSILQVRKDKFRVHYK